MKLTLGFPFVLALAITTMAQPVDSNQRVVVVLADGNNAQWVHAGALEAIEGYGLPVQTVVGSGAGAVAAELWCSGYSAQRITALFASQDWRGSWSGDPEVDQQWIPLADTGLPLLRADYSLQEVGKDSSRLVRLDTRPLDLRGARLQVLLSTALADAPARRCKVETALTDAEGKPLRSRLRNPAEAAVASMGLTASQFSAGALSAAVPLGTPFPTGGYLTLVVLPDPFRKPMDNSDPSRQALIQQQISNARKSAPEGSVFAQPVSFRSDSSQNPAFLWSQGFQAVRARLGEISALLPEGAKRVASHAAVPDLAGLMDRRDEYQLTLDSVPSEVQDHLRSFLETDTNRGSARLLSAMNNAASTGLYSEVSLVPDGEEVRARAKPRNRIELGVGGFGDNRWGPHLAASGYLRFLDQSEYRMGATGWLGAEDWRFLPSVTLLRMRASSFAASVSGDLGAKDFEGAHAVADSPFSSSRVYSESWKATELDLSYSMASLDRLRFSALYLRTDLSTGAARLLERRDPSSSPVDPVPVVSMASGLKWESPSPVSAYSLEPLSWYLQCSFRAVSVQRLGVSSAPLYTRIQGQFSPRYQQGLLLLGTDLAAGFDALSASGNGGAFPDSLFLVAEQVSDPAIGNRFRMEVPVTPWELGQIDPRTRSHGYLLGSLATALQRNGTGVWLRLGTFLDMEGDDLENEIEHVQRFAEASIKMRYHSLEFASGVWRIANSKSSMNEWTDSEQWKVGLRVGMPVR